MKTKESVIGPQSPLLKIFSKFGVGLDFEKIDYKPLLFHCEYNPDANEQFYRVVYLLFVLKCPDLKIKMANLNRYICVECTKHCVNNENCLKCVFCSRYLDKDCFATEQTLPKNSADKSEAVCLPCSIKVNTNNSTDISAHNLIESSTGRKPHNVVSNPICEDLFDNCAYHDQKST